MPAPPAQAQPEAATGGDAAAKARLVVTIARFVQWPVPRDTEQPLTLCVVQASPAVAVAFSAHAGSQIGSRTLQVQAGADPACHVLYVDASAPPPGGALLAAAAARATLTLGSRAGFAAGGGMVEIVLVDDALRFDVNLPALRAAQLGVNPGVLKLARRVRQ